MTTFTFEGLIIESNCTSIRDLVTQLETALAQLNMRMDYASVAMTTDIIAEDPVQLSLDLALIIDAPIELQLWRELHGI